MSAPSWHVQASALALIEDQLRFERLLAELSARFINLPAAQVDEAVVDSLRQIVEITGVDRVQLIRITRQPGDARVTHSWARAGVLTVSRIALGARYPWALARVFAGEPVIVPRVDRLPAECAVDKASWQSVGSKSCLVVPMRVAGAIEGAMAFGSLTRERDWTDAFVTQAGILADVFANALAHKRAQLELHNALAFERLLANVSASILRVPLQGADEAIEAALRAIGEFLDVDRVGFWRMQDATPALAYVWVAPGSGASPEIAGKGAIRSLFAPIARGEVVNMPDIDGLGDGAAFDRKSLDRYGTRALLAVPLRDDRSVVGALSVATVRGAREWPESLIPRLGLVGEAFAGVLAHRNAAEQVRDAQSDAARHRERLAHMARVHTVGEMSAAIAHEINQPLVAIENYALAAHRRLTSPAGVETAKLEELLGKIRAQAGRAGDVIRRLRAMVKQHDSEQCLVDLSTLVSGAVRLAEMESRLTGFHIQLTQAGPPSMVMVDEIQIQQVLINLVRNGIEAMAGAGVADMTLRVEVARVDPKEAIVRVIDSGPGVAPGSEARIFDPFYSTKANGLGIGLAVCRSIVESHGGELSYAPAERGGASFHFTLPLAGRESRAGADA